MEHKQTPSQTVGPFFHYGLLTKDDFHILTQDGVQGEQIYIKGEVTDGNGEAIPDAMIEIWQADSAGYHNHPDDPNAEKADPNFKGFGRADTVSGNYTFKTVKPGSVPYDASTQQAPHINVRVFARGMLIHAYTRLYFSDEAEANANDPILSLVDADRRATLIATREETGDLVTYRFNIRMQGDGETVFFQP